MRELFAHSIQIHNYTIYLSALEPNDRNPTAFVVVIGLHHSPGLSGLGRVHKHFRKVSETLSWKIKRYVDLVGIPGRSIAVLDLHMDAVEVLRVFQPVHVESDVFGNLAAEDFSQHGLRCNRPGSAFRTLRLSVRKGVAAGVTDFGDGAVQIEHSVGNVGQGTEGVEEGMAALAERQSCDMGCDKEALPVVFIAPGPVDEREVVQGHERMGSERTDRGLGDAAPDKCCGEVVRYSPGTVPVVTGCPAEIGEVGPYGLECRPKETVLVPLDGTAPDIKGTVKTAYVVVGSGGEGVVVISVIHRSSF